MDSLGDQSCDRLFPPPPQMVLDWMGWDGWGLGGWLLDEWTDGGALDGW